MAITGDRPSPDLGEVLHRNGDLKVRLVGHRKVVFSPDHGDASKIEELASPHSLSPQGVPRTRGWLVKLIELYADLNRHCR